MASIRKTKKFLKNSKGFLTIKIKDESIENGDILFVTSDDTMTFRMFGVVFSFNDYTFKTVDTACNEVFTNHINLF